VPETLRRRKEPAGILINENYEEWQAF